MTARHQSVSPYHLLNNQVKRSVDDLFRKTFYFYPHQEDRRELDCGTAFALLRGQGSSQKTTLDGVESMETRNSYGLDKHASCQEWVDSLGTKAYRQHLVFSVVRNPWDRIVSHFFHKRKWKEGKTDFDENSFFHWLQTAKSIKSEVHYKAPRALGFLLSKPIFGLDYILRLESLDDDWNRLCTLLKIPYLPLNQRNRGEHDNYRQYYNSATYKMVTELCQWEIDHFDYRF